MRLERRCRVVSPDVGLEGISQVGCLYVSLVERVVGLNYNSACNVAMIAVAESEDYSYYKSFDESIPLL